MFYKIDLKVPALTSWRAPVEKRVRVFPGVTRRVWVMFPPGPKGLVHVAIWHWGWQVWPWAPGTDFAWDNYVYTFEDRYPMRAEPFEFIMKGWSYDDFFPHTISFAVSIEPSPPMREISALELVLMNRRLMMEGKGMVRGER